MRLRASLVWSCHRLREAESTPAAASLAGRFNRLHLVQWLAEPPTASHAGSIFFYAICMSFLVSYPSTSEGISSFFR
jgi:hypothetical protein